MPLDNYVKIRSITAFVDPREIDQNVEGEIAKSTNLLESLVKTLRNKDLEPWTARISFPANSVSIFNRIVNDVDINRFLISLGYTDFNPSMRNIYLDAVEKGFYISFNGLKAIEKNLAGEISRFIHKASSRNPVCATRISVGFHEEPLQTPYFPDSSSINGGVGLSFLYPRFITRNLEHGLTGAFDEFKKTVAKVVGYLEAEGSRVLVDYSLSPWMEDSIIDLLQRVGYHAGQPGFNYGLLMLNKEIWRISDKYAVGFNEVMLPYAEDNGLKKLGEAESIRAKDLLLYTATCVSGPDMLVVPEDEEKLASFIKDVYAIYTFKRRPLAARLIPTTGKPGDKIDLGRFGETTVIPY
ncbi:DUF711 family protein [Candidatus Bathyarchaeota archaeon]|nr:DUF711 family protein [Candidatus Bathyarchaeota archaeon]